jgi:hypothetical protein
MDTVISKGELCLESGKYIFCVAQRCSISPVYLVSNQGLAMSIDIGSSACESADPTGRADTPEYPINRIIDAVLERPA